MQWGNDENWDALLQAADRALLEGITDVDVHLDRAKALLKLRRYSDARSALAASREADEAGWSEAQIAELEKELRAAEEPAGG